MSLIKFSKTDVGDYPKPVFINPESVTSVMPAFTLHPGGSGITVHGFTYPILVDQSPEEVAEMIQRGCGL